jgi:hypothetical protein
MSEKPYEFDVFISHADDDHADVVFPLVELLRFDYGLKVWYDDDKDITTAGTLMDKIEYGLKNSRCGVPIISPKFISKRAGWIGDELVALIDKQHKTDEPVFFPVWFRVTKQQVKDSLLILANYDALILRDKREIESLAHDLAQKISKKQLPKKSNRLSETKQIEQLNKMGEEGFTALIHLLNNPDIKIRLAAIRKLGERQDVRAIQPLFQVIRQIRAAKINEIKADRDNYLLLLTTTDSLAKTDKAAVPSLIQALNDEYWLVRWVALSALWKIEDPMIVLPLIERLHDKQVDVRRDAAYVLGDRGSLQATKSLKQALRDADEIVRTYAQDALNKISGEAELDEREDTMLRDLCKAARKPSGYLQTVRSFKVFDPFDPSNELKRDVARSLEDKGYVEITSKDFTLKLSKPKGYNFCMNLQEQHQ